MMDYYHRDYIRNLCLFRRFHDYFMNNPQNGRIRVTIMDADNFPDLREFYEILEIVICGAVKERIVEI